MREDVRLGPPGEQLAAWFYPPPGGGPAPVVVLGIGLGSVKEMGLDGYARAFQARGYAALAFDHRHFGASDGTPRQLLDVRRQQADWRTAIAQARRQPGVDPERVVLWGTSFGGGHAVAMAAERPAGVVAALAQCPFTDGVASALAMHPLSALRVSARAVRDLAAAARGRPPVVVATAGPPRSAGLMTAPDALDGFLGLVPPGPDGSGFENEVCARIGLRIIGYRPGLSAGRIEVPLWVGVCDRDTVAPPRRTARLLGRAPRAEVRHYDAGHFEIYREPWFDRVVADQLAFLDTHVPPG